MLTTQTKLEWEVSSREKYERMVRLIPLFHREIAKQVVDKKAEENAIKRNSGMVEEADILNAFFSEVPKAFYSLMIRLMSEVGFNYKEYESK